MIWNLPDESRGVVSHADQRALSNEVRDHLRRTLGDGESVMVIPGTLRATPDTDHYARLEAQGLRELRASRDGQTIERRTFPAAR